MRFPQAIRITAIEKNLLRALWLGPWGMSLRMLLLLLLLYFWAR